MARIRALLLLALALPVCACSSGSNTGGGGLDAGAVCTSRTDCRVAEICYAGHCEGACTEGNHRCTGSTTFQLCDFAGDWTSDGECTNAHGQTACKTNRCAPSCDSGYGDCDGNPDNGCETSLAGDAHNCGACGNACAPDQICKGGACEKACVSEVAMGSSHSCALRGDGTVWCWGGNGAGQIGDGTNTTATQPVQVGALGTDVLEIAAGADHTCARKSDGSVWCWGRNVGGALGDGTQTDSSTPLQVAGLGTKVEKLGLGRYHSCAIETDGTLWCWGSNNSGKLGDGTITDQPTPVEVAALGNEVAQVQGGTNHTCAIETSGSLWCWGNNSSNQLGTGTTGTYSSTPLEVPTANQPIAEVAPGLDLTYALRKDGTLWYWGDGSALVTPHQVYSSLGTVTEIAVADYHFCARKSDGTLWCWGGNSAGELGDGTTTDNKSPGQVTALKTDVLDVAVGLHSTCARKNDGTLWCWGKNPGDGGTQARTSPTATVLTCP